MRAGGLAGVLLSIPDPRKIQQKISKVQDLLPLAVRNTEPHFGWSAQWWPPPRLKRSMIWETQATLKVQSSATQWSPDGPPSAL
jgi:hypothetical protein